MEVYLAGYNIDKEVIDELAKNNPRDDITPETISAAYARISRDARPVNELRNISRLEVEKAKKSNKTIIFEMGHHSVAEHAVFNFDVIDLSRLAIEHIEHFRLASYTEKSQRYQKIENQSYTPSLIKNSHFLTDYLAILEEQRNFYIKLYETIYSYLREQSGNKTQSELKQFDIMAKEDARYILPLSTHGQLGMTVNARTLELMLRRFAGSKIEEIVEFGNKLYEHACRVAPSLILFAKSNEYDEKTYDNLKAIADGFNINSDNRDDSDVNLISHTIDPDDTLLAMLLHSVKNISYSQCVDVVKKMGYENKIKFIKEAFSNLQFFDAVLREFEHINLTYSLILSSACFGQFKRHRMASITYQEYDPSLSFTIPPLVYNVGLEKEFSAIIDKTDSLYNKINRELPTVSQYVLTNAHRKRVVCTLNARELYHISRLREDAHAQWDIRRIVEKMTNLARERMPLATLLISGKDSFLKKYEEVFGKKPKYSSAPEH